MKLVSLVLALICVHWTSAADDQRIRRDAFVTIGPVDGIHPPHGDDFRWGNTHDDIVHATESTHHWDDHHTTLHHDDWWGNTHDDIVHVSETRQTDDDRHFTPPIAPIDHFDDFHHPTPHHDDFHDFHHPPTPHPDDWVVATESARTDDHWDRTDYHVDDLLNRATSSISDPAPTQTTDPWHPSPPCLLANTNFAGRGVGKVRKADTWRDCAARCHKNKKCFGWSYATDEHPVAKYRKNCHLKNNTFKKGKTATKGVVSGDKACGIAPDYSYKNYKNKQCGDEKWYGKGCYKTNRPFKRGKLLVYWRHDIEWDGDRISSFASSLACACAEAARAQGVKFFGLHYWGECWALDIADVKYDHEGDCTLADGTYNTKCLGAFNKDWGHTCLGGSRSYFLHVVLSGDDRPDYPIAI